jgi:hypothetical protein
LEAWGDLKLLANDRKERVRRLATRRPEPEYLKPAPAPVTLTAAERFARALGRLREHSRVSSSATAPDGSSMPFWSAVPFGEGTPPRAAWWLRRILLRIHLAIHGPSS